MHKGTGQDAIMRRIEADMRGGEVVGTLGPPGPPGLSQTVTIAGADKRPKLERAHSAAEKENLPLLQRSGSALRRQFSQQDPRQAGELDGLMRAHPHLLHPRQQQQIHPSSRSTRRRAPNSPSSSDEELRSTPDCPSDENDKGKSFIAMYRLTLVHVLFP